MIKIELKYDKVVVQKIHVSNPFGFVELWTQQLVSERALTTRLNANEIRMLWT